MDEKGDLDEFKLEFKKKRRINKQKKKQKTEKREEEEREHQGIGVEKSHRSSTKPDRSILFCV